MIHSIQRGRRKGGTNNGDEEYGGQEKSNENEQNIEGHENLEDEMEVGGKSKKREKKRERRGHEQEDLNKKKRVSMEGEILKQRG